MREFFFGRDLPMAAASLAFETASRDKRPDQADAFFDAAVIKR